MFLIRKIRSLLGEKKTPHVVIGSTTRVYKSAVIENRNGGTIKIGEGCEIFDGVLILSYGGNIKIGDNCSINPYAIIYGHGGLRIGNNVLIAGGVMIIPNNHNFIEKDRIIIEQGCTAQGIVIEDDVWIGHGCSILDGVIVREGTVIAAGSVVNQSTEPYSIVAGVPAKVIKYRI